MAEELFVRMVDINQLLPNCCDVCREQIEDLRAVHLDGERLNDVRRLLERVHEDAKGLMQWANQTFSERRPRRPLTPLEVRHLSERIQAEVEKSFGLPAAELLKRTNVVRIAWPRQIASYLIRQLTYSSFPIIGRYFEMHHTTVVHSCEKVSRALAKDKKLAQRVHKIVVSVERPL